MSTEYPTFAESYSQGVKLGMEDIQNKEIAKYAPQTALDTYNTSHADSVLKQQAAQLGTYDVKAASLLDQAGTPSAPTQNYEAIYGKTSGLQTKVELAKQKLAKAEQLKNATMSSGKFSNTARQNYEDAQAEAKLADAELKTFQAESLEKALAPAMAARDQATWDDSKVDLVEAAVQGATQDAIKKGVPEENIKAMQDDIRKKALAALPKAWGPSAKNFIEGKVAGLMGIKASNTMEEELRKEEKHQQDIREYNSKIAENLAQRDKALTEARGGNPKALSENAKASQTAYSTASLAADKYKVSEQVLLESKLRLAKTAADSIFSNEEDKTTLKQVQAEMDEFNRGKKAADKLLATTLKDFENDRALARATGAPLPKEEPPPNPDADLNKAEVQYQTTPSAQGMSVEEVLKDLHAQKPGYTIEQYLAVAIKRGYITTKEVAPASAPKVVPKEVVPKKKEVVIPDNYPVWKEKQRQKEVEREFFRSEKEAELRKKVKQVYSK